MGAELKTEAGLCGPHSQGNWAQPCSAHGTQCPTLAIGNGPRLRSQGQGLTSRPLQVCAWTGHEGGLVSLTSVPGLGPVPAAVDSLREEPRPCRTAYPGSQAPAVRRRRLMKVLKPRERPRGHQDCPGCQNPGFKVSTTPGGRRGTHCPLLLVQAPESPCALGPPHTDACRSHLLAGRQCPRSPRASG